MKSLHILYLTTELAPLTGDGDLARENRFLARQLADFGCAVTAVVPRHAVDDPGRHGLARRLSPLTLPRSELPATVYEGTLSGGRVEVVTVEVAAAPDPDAVYRDSVLAVVQRDDGWPDAVVVSHGAEPALLELMDLARSRDDREVPVVLFALRRFEGSDVLRQALAVSDRIVVSSPTWAESLRREPDSHPAGALVAPVLDRLRGVTSGIDSLEWNPRRDRHMLGDLIGSPHETKARHKAALQRELGLRLDPGLPLVALVGPLDLDVLPYTAASEISQRGLQLVVLGERERDGRCLRGLQRLAQGSSSHLAVRTTDDSDRSLEHRVLAAADFALFARSFDPGATCELYCMHYGAVPIAPTSGTFTDVIVEFDSNSMTGSGFLYTPMPGHDEPIVGAVDRALRAYARDESFAALSRRVMHLDLSWHTAAQRYINLLLEVLRDRRELAA